MVARDDREPPPPDALASGDSWMWTGACDRSGLSVSGSAPSPGQIQDSLDAARKPVLRDRAKIAVGAVILITTVFLVMGIVAGIPTGWTPPFVRLTNLALVLFVWGWLQRDHSLAEIEWMTLGAVAFSCVCSGIVSTLEGDAMNASLGLFAVTLGCATFLPWRMRMQVLLVLVTALTLLTTFFALHARIHFTAAISIVTIIGTFIATVYMVHILQDVRRRGVVDDLMRRRAEEQLRIANDALEERVEERTAEVRAAMHELETFNYSVSHDLRSPLRVINGMVQLVEDEFPGKLDEATSARFHRVKLATRRLDELMDAILARSRVAQAEMRPCSIDLSALGDALVAELRADHPEREIVWARPDRLVATGDPRLIRIVLENLLDNAWKFTRTREAATIELGVTANGRRNEFRIRDNGIGFDKSLAPKLFENFQRYHGEEYEGHGIGLSVARRIIERHGGSIRVESESGVGTTVYFTLGDAPPARR